MILTVTLNTSIDKLYIVDALNPYEVSRVKSVNNTAGGKGLNVSRIAAQLGQSVTAMGFVGGHTGAYFESLIDQTNITKAFTHVQGQTRSCINIWDSQKNLSTEYLEPGAPVTEQDARKFFDDFTKALPCAAVVTISGSMPGGMPKDSYAKMIELCRAAGKPVLLDTSGETLKRAVAAGPTFVKPNTDELGQLTGRAIAGMDQVTDAARSLFERGIQNVVVSMGARGAFMLCREGAFMGIPPKITPVNTVGCGDSMVGGFAVGFAQGMDAVQRLRLAVAVSAANALSMATGSFERSELDRISPLVTIEKIDI